MFFQCGERYQIANWPKASIIGQNVLCCSGNSIQYGFVTLPRLDLEDFLPELYPSTPTFLEIKIKETYLPLFWNYLEGKRY